MKTISLLGGVLLLAACAQDVETEAAVPEPVEPARTEAATPVGMQARASIINPQGEQIGTATFIQEENGVQVEAEVSGLSSGAHGFHIHETGMCEPTDFSSAGDHFNPTNQQHGLEIEAGPHAGDLPNILIGEDGSGSQSVLNPYVTLDEGSTSLLGGSGTALMIHEGSDDYQSQPSGDAGSRVGCGVIEPA